jgi:uncharacterized membrane protein YcaP (DUF421 family)
MLFGGWTALGRTVVVGVLAYVALVLLLRLSGKRTLSKFNAFDFVVTVAIGSTLATVLLSEQVALAQGVTAFTVLLTLQFVITWLSVRSARVRELVKGEPALLLHRGEYLSGALRRERITREELLAAAREQGVASLDDVESAVLETDGTITIVRSAPEAQPSTLSGVRGYPAPRGGPDAS